MSGYNTECIPRTTQVAAGASRRELHLQLTVVFACGRKVPYGYSYRFKPSENRRPCKGCAATVGMLPSLSWEEIEQRFARAYAKLGEDTSRKNAPAEAVRE